MRKVSKKTVTARAELATAYEAASESRKFVTNNPKN